MKIKSLTTMVLLLLLLMMTYGFRSTDFTFKKQGNGLKNANIQQIVFHPNNSTTIMARDNAYLYISFNKGKTFEVLLHKRAVYDVFVNDEVALLSVHDGLYAMDLTSYQWEKMIATSDDNPFVAAVANDGIIYAATLHDLYRKDSFSAQFKKIPGAPNNETFTHLFSFQQQFYAMTNRALLSLKGDDWREVLKAGIAGESAEILMKDAVEIDDQLVVATARGVYVSSDSGQSWKLLEGLHINGDDIQSLATLGRSLTTRRHGVYHKESAVDGLLIGTLNGLFVFQDNALERLVDGLESQAVADVVWRDGKIYAATDKGIFITEMAAPARMDEDSAVEGDVWADEPDIAQVQQWAIELAEVDPDKIKEWRRLAKKKALLPSVSMGVDGGHDWGASNSLWGSSSGALFLGPDDKTYGGDIGWDITLSWDLSDYIWSTDQTTIDGRSKLMVELREDILDQVTRYYFERRRLIAETRFTEAANAYEEFQRKLRIDELTAYLDGYTGGEFSKYIKN